MTPPSPLSGPEPQPGGPGQPAAPAPWIIRTMLPGDLPSILAIAAASPEAPQWAASAYAAYFDPDAVPLRTALSAVLSGESGKILGFAALTLLPDASAETTSGSPPALCELDTIAVHPVARRQGVAAALLQTTLAWAADRGARRLVLDVRVSNTAALHLYHRFGFVEEGRRPRYYTHPQEDALLLGRPVTPAAPTNPFSTENSIEGGPPRC